MEKFYMEENDNATWSQLKNHMRYKHVKLITYKNILCTPKISYLHPVLGNIYFNHWSEEISELI